MDSPRQLLPDASGWRQLWARVRTLWRVKMAANILGMGAFFAAYFWVLHHPQFRVIVMPLIPLDRWIAFEPAALPLYASLWLYVSLPLALLTSRRELVSYGWASLALSAIGLTLFLLVPTSVPEAGIDWARHPSIAFLKAVDVGDNACPSLHVAFAVFSAVWLARQLRELRADAALQALNAAWCIGILYSTLATRQHVVLDVLAGALLGLLVVGLQLWALDRPPSAARSRATEAIGTAI